MRCPNCGKADLVDTIVAEYDVGRAVGLSVAIVLDAPVMKCPECNQTTVSGDLLDHMLPILADTVIEHSYELDGEGARFLRKFIGLTQEDLAAQLRISRDTVIRWEKSGNVLPGPETIALCSLVQRHRTRNMAEHVRALMDGARSAGATGFARRLVDLVLTRDELHLLHSMLRIEPVPSPAEQRERAKPHPRAPFRISAPTDRRDSAPPNC